MAGIKVVIFDLGDVIVDIVWLNQNPRFLAKCKVPLRDVDALFEGGGAWWNFEKGLISGEEFSELAASRLKYVGGAKEFRKDLSHMLEASINQQVFDIICSLKLRHGRNIDLWLLSNLNEDHYRYLREKWPGIFANFFEVFLSFELGERKPDEAIYKKVLAKGGAAPASCLFFDDRKENVLGAKRAGIEGRLFEGSAGLKRDLAAAGLAIP